ncbi:MAG: hypothetical protein RIT45_3692 [Pseudomonadota bacterium]
MATLPTDTPTPAPDDPKNPFFEALARLTVRHPILALLLTVAGTLAFGGLAATRLQMDNSVEAFTSSASDAREILERFRDDFGRDDFFLVMVEGDVFSRPYLERLRALHDELAQLDMEIPTLGQRKPRRHSALGGPEPAPVVPPAPRRAKAKAPPAAPSEATVAAAATATPAGSDDDPFADFEGAGETGGGGAEAATAATGVESDFGTFGEEGEDLAWGDEAGGTIIDEITSILNVRRTQAVGDGIRIGGWLEPLPEATALPKLREQILAEPTLVGQVVGAAGRHSVITMRTAFMSEEDSARVYREVMAICERHRAPGFEPRVAGPPALGAAINDIILGDLRRTGVVAVLAMLSALLFLFRHPMGIVGPLLVVGQAAIWTFGLMAAVGWPMTMLSNILPAFLVCVGIGDSVHIQSVYRDARRRGRDNDDAIVYAIATTGMPVLFTTLTTMVGLLSFRFATVDAIGEMGTAGAFGVVVALIHSVVFLPAFLTFNRKSLLGANAAGGGAGLDRFLDLARLFSADPGAPSGGLRNAPKRRRALLLGLLFAGLSVVGMGGLRVYHNPLSWIPEKFPVRPAFDLIDEHIGGTANVQLLISAKEGRTIKDLELMRGLEGVLEHVRAWRYPDTDVQLVGNAISLVDVVKETNRALHGGDPAFYRLPDDDRALSDLLFLFENAGPDQLRRLATNDLRKTQATIRVRWVDATSYGPFTEYLDEGIRKHIGDRAVVEKTGAVYSLFNIVSSIIADLIRSFGVAFVIITVMMVLMLRNLRLGLIAMVPNLLPIMMIMGLMGAVGVPIDMSNLLIASIAIGIAVDDTIHFLHHFQAHYQRRGDVEAAISYTFHHSGRAMVSTSVILAMGFCVYISAQMTNLARFGVLVALTVVMALLIDLIFAPALLRWAYRDRKEEMR